MTVIATRRGESERLAGIRVTEQRVVRRAQMPPTHVDSDDLPLASVPITAGTIDKYMGLGNSL